MIHWNRNEVRLTHIPTGIQTGANGARSQHRNRDSAYQQLRGKLYAGTPEMEVVATYTMPEGVPWPDDIGQHRRNLK
mgnify:CR=1 FL=1